ncbi:MAG: methyltransferase family protein [Promethearchaeota archaeon]
MKGIDQLRKKLPDYQGRKIRVFVVIALIVFVTSIMFQLVLDSIPRIFRSIAILQMIAPLTPIIGPLIVISIGLSIVYKFWRVRDEYLSKYGIKAYQKAFKFVAIGIPMVLSVIVHSFFSNDLIVIYKIDDTLSRYLGVPIFGLVLDFPSYILYIRLFLSILFVGLGLTVVFKALSLFGIDNMALIYVFYPEESTLQNHEIYSLLRHPTYHGLMLISIGSIFFRFSIYSVIYFLIFLVGINIHLKYVEEKELIQRFGGDYKKYREDVPAFFVKLKDLRRYFSTLFKN